MAKKTKLITGIPEKVETASDRRKQYAEILMGAVEKFINTDLKDIQTNHDQIMQKDMVLVEMVIFQTSYDFKGYYIEGQAFNTRIPIVRILDMSPNLKQDENENPYTMDLVTPRFEIGKYYRLANSTIAPRVNTNYEAWLAMNASAAEDKSSGRIKGGVKASMPKKYVDSFEKTILPRVFFSNPIFPIVNQANMFLLPKEYLITSITPEKILSSTREYVSVIMSSYK